MKSAELLEGTGVVLGCVRTDVSVGFVRTGAVIGLVRCVVVVDGTVSVEGFFDVE